MTIHQLSCHVGSGNNTSSFYTIHSAVMEDEAAQLYGAHLSVA